MRPYQNLPMLCETLFQGQERTAVVMVVIAVVCLLPSGRLGLSRLRGADPQSEVTFQRAFKSHVRTAAQWRRVEDFLHPTEGPAETDSGKQGIHFRSSLPQVHCEGWR